MPPLALVMSLAPECDAACGGPTSRPAISSRCGRLGQSPLAPFNVTNLVPPSLHRELAHGFTCRVGNTALSTREHLHTSRPDDSMHGGSMVCGSVVIQTSFTRQRGYRASWRRYRAGRAPCPGGRGCFLLFSPLPSSCSACTLHRSLPSPLDHVASRSVSPAAGTY